MNITDVGHLTSDADTGEDKMEKGARRTGKTAWEIAQLYTDAFIDDMARLNIEMPSVLCRATDHIQDQIEFIADIEKNGFTYRTSDGIYFNTSLQPDYGFLARLDKAGLEAGKRVELGEKKASPTSRCGNSRRPASIGRWNGRARGAPASRAGTSNARRWRRSTSATFSTSIAAAKITSRSITPTKSRRPRRASGRGSPTSGCTRYFLLSNDAKMAKSAGEFLRLQSLIDRGYDPLAYRYLCLTAHYRSQLNFTWDALDAAAKGLDRLRNGVFALGETGANARRTGRRIPRALHRGNQRRPEPAARTGAGVGGASRRT